MKEKLSLLVACLLLCFASLSLASPAPANPATTPAPANINDVNADKCSLTARFSKAAGRATVKPRPWCTTWLETTVTQTATRYTATDTVTQTRTRGTTTVTTTTTTQDTTTTTTTSTVTDVITTCAGPSKKKRTVAATPTPAPVQHVPATSNKQLPSWLNGWTVQQVNQVCHCLCAETPPKTTTTTVTQTLAHRTTTITVKATTTTTVTQPGDTVTSTETATTSTTIEYCPPAAPPTDCGNTGLQWGYARTPEFYNNDPTFSNFDPSVIQTRAALANGSTTSVSGFSGTCNGGTNNFYGNTLPCDFFALSYRGYLYAGESGTYLFSSNSPDDIVLLWTGATAYTGYTRGNAVFVLPYGNAANNVPINANKGDYIPIRIMLDNAETDFDFQITVTAPSGGVILGPNTPSSPNIVQFACEGALAPEYQDWGNEAAPQS